MKRIGGLFDRIASRETLAWAAWRAARGKRNRRAVVEFMGNMEEEADAIASALRAGAYEFARARRFEVRDTKTRTIHAPAFRDRVVHHAIIAAVGPIFDRGAIHRTYACRKGRGQHAALRQATRWARESGWFLKCDMAKFYDSIDHAILESRLARRFRENRLLDLFGRLLDSFHGTPGKGLPIGSLTSQYLGNFYLDGLDHHVLERSGVRSYMRYMDDLLAFGSKERMLALRDEIRVQAAGLALVVKDGGVLNRCELGVPWLGFTLYPGRTRLNREGRKRLRRRLRHAEGAYLEGGIGEEELQSRARALFAHACFSDDAAWRRTVISFSRIGEAQESRQPGGPWRLLEQQGQELPLCEPQQEASRQPQQEPGLPPLPAPRHGCAEPQPDDAPSRAPAAPGDETLGPTPPGTDILRTARDAGMKSTEKAPGGGKPASDGAP